MMSYFVTEDGEEQNEDIFMSYQNIQINFVGYF